MFSSSISLYRFSIHHFTKVGTSSLQDLDLKTTGEGRSASELALYTMDTSRCLWWCNFQGKRCGSSGFDGKEAELLCLYPWIHSNKWHRGNRLTWWCCRRPSAFCLEISKCLESQLRLCIAEVLLQCHEQWIECWVDQREHCREWRTGWRRTWWLRGTRRPALQASCNLNSASQTWAHNHCLLRRKDYFHIKASWSKIHQWKSI